MGGAKYVDNVVPRWGRVNWNTILVMLGRVKVHNLGSIEAGKYEHNVVPRWGRVNWYTILLKLGRV